MQRKLRFRWKEKTEKSVTEIMSEDGRMSVKDILYIIDDLCRQLEDLPLETYDRNVCFHPDNVLIGERGTVRLAEQEIPFPTMEAWFPPELTREDPITPSATVYSLGILMLYMAAGDNKRAEADVSVNDRTLLYLIKKCIAFDPKERFQNPTELRAAVRQKSRAGKKMFLILPGAVLLSLFMAAIFFFWRSGEMLGSAEGEDRGSKSGFSQGFEQGFSDAPGFGINASYFDSHNGSLSGNYSQEGGAIATFCEEAVFYLAEDNIYRMDPYTEETELLTTAPEARDLQYYEERLYYCTQKDVIRLDPKTAKADVVCESRGGSLYIFEDTFYLYDNEDTGYLYRIDPEKETLTQLNGEMTYRSLNIVGDKLYYIDETRGNFIYSSDLDGSNERLISSSAYESFCICENRLYAGTEDGLVRMDLNGGSPEKLTFLSAHFPIAAGGGVFFLSGGGRNLVWISSDGRTRYTVVPGCIESFNAAGLWIFYRNSDDGGQLWRVRINGTGAAKVTR